MKSIYKSLLFLFMAFAMTGIFASCSDDDSLPEGGKPMISYIRIPEPESSDSLIVAAGQGSIIVVVGENLQAARELWINDRRAQMIPTLVTNTTIFTMVPPNIPTVITNKMKIIFADGDSLLHDFVVDISKPVITNMVSEFVPTGESAVIRGDFFYAPLTVTFAGGVTGKIVAMEDDMIEVSVPEGAEPGPITITTNFGETESDFWFRDNRNVIANFENDNFEGWWHGNQYIVSSDADIQPISDKFLRINREIGPWGWFEMWVGNGGTILENTSNIPAAAFASPKDFSLKFEINTLAPLTGAEIRMYMGPDMGGERGDIHYIWKPNVDTQGNWETISIPFDEFLAANTTLKYDPAGYGVSFHFSGPLAVNAQFGLDNIRVVPNQ